MEGTKISANSNNNNRKKILNKKWKLKWHRARYCAIFTHIINFVCGRERRDEVVGQSGTGPISGNRHEIGHDNLKQQFFVFHCRILHGVSFNADGNVNEKSYAVFTIPTYSLLPLLSPYIPPHLFLSPSISITHFFKCVISIDFGRNRAIWFEWAHRFSNPALDRINQFQSNGIGLAIFALEIKLIYAYALLNVNRVDSMEIV